MILYFTYWFPPLHRARIVDGFSSPPLFFFVLSFAVLFLGERPRRFSRVICFFYLDDRGRPREVAFFPFFLFYASFPCGCWRRCG